MRNVAVTIYCNNICGKNARIIKTKFRNQKTHAVKHFVVLYVRITVHL